MSAGKDLDEPSTRNDVEARPAARFELEDGLPVAKGAPGLLKA